MNPVVRQAVQVLLAFLGYGLATVVVTTPVAVEQAIEGVRFEDRLGTLPVQVSLCHNGFSTLDTGVLGSVYWERTGTAGFGACIRATGPPEAGDTLSSYVSPKFVQANAQFVNDPSEVARVYGGELRSQLLLGFLEVQLWSGLIGGTVLSIIFRARHPFPRRLRSPWHRAGAATLCLVVGLGFSSLLAFQLFRQWDGSAEVTTAYRMPGDEQLSFSSPQTLEVAQQVRPFIDKNTDRIRARAEEYQASAEASLRTMLPVVADRLAPGEDERIVVAEADPQGSLVGTRVREVLYPLLEEYLGDDAIAARTISGDISSNGTVAEEGFVRGEATASPDIPTVAVEGDHDSEATVEQLLDDDVLVPDLEPVDVDGLEIVGANDPAFKTLFGGLVTNESGITETELGAMLREQVDEDFGQDDPVIVLLHQPTAAASYLGIDSTDELRAAEGRETTPWDDGIPDLPPGSVNIGHLHDASGPWVVWNTDGDLVTWTVVSQLGTSGGVEESPTFNRFSTPFSVPLKDVSVQLQYVNTESGLQTGYATIDFATDGSVQIGERVDLGLPGGQPMTHEELESARPASAGRR